MPLTHNEIAALPAKKTPYYTFDDTRTRGTGRLGIQVHPSGNKVHVFRYKKDGKWVFIRLGNFPNLKLVDAREKAKTLGQMIRDGLDPKDEQERQSREREQVKREHEQQGTVEQLFRSYTEQMKKDGKRTHGAVLVALEKETYPHLSKTTKAKDVTAHDIKIILAHMIRRGADTQSNRVRSYLMAAFNYGLKHDHDPANLIDDAKFGLVMNPVGAIPKQKAAERVGERFLSWGEARQLLDDMEQPTSLGPTLRSLIRLCFFTGGQRPYELAVSRWANVDWQAKTLTIAADISKNGRTHLIPLTDSALRVLRFQQGVTGDSPFIFPHAHQPDEPMPMASLSQAIDRYRKRVEMEHFIPRDFRRTCKTLMGELGIAKDLRDRLQNHALNDVSSKHYDRYEYLPEKREALELWEQHLLHTEISTDV
ncbi:MULTISPECIES: tyrosine-type recombinase/integrase [Aeromonas]|uniref:tyrosine-type recombinase/integrase n=1 Tax=Aeromonas TaxID=642 RepID=UPI000F769E04|nr:MULTISPECIES: site-specific integrase [Aeromonas]MDX7598672.1 integrase arm-type DNA-binding domain-containing protein [Aeromonas caviae]RSM25316.1 integrase [Aeromonas salmonicida]GJA10560.1 integrase [Aeromonas caviae]